MDIREEYGLFIGGEERDGSETFTVHDPATNSALATVHEAGQQGVATAATDSADAFETWSETDAHDRAQILQTLAGGIRESHESLARIETLEMGRPLEQSKRNVTKAARYFEYYAGLIDKIEGTTIPVPGERHNYTVHEPLGVTGHIVPWNAALNLGSRSIAPALACGNTVVVKPSPEAPLSLLEFGKLAVDSGLPAGVLNVVPGDGEHTGAAVVENDLVRNITFTGSRETGSTVMKAAGDRIVPVSLELGGNSPNIVFPDARLEQAATDSVKALGNSGQVCHAPTRIFVHESVHDDFVDLLLEEIEPMTVGPGVENHDIGPLISPSALERVSQYVDAAGRRGATCLIGGDVPDRDGNYYPPTVLGNVPDDDPISCDEVFGPVLKVYTFRTESEVIRRANDTEYGLYAVVWTNDVSRAHSMARAIDAGAVSVNEYPATFVQSPFGGYKESGIGREKGQQAVEHYTQQKNVNIRL